MSDETSGEKLTPRPVHLPAKLPGLLAADMADAYEKKISETGSLRDGMEAAYQVLREAMLNP